MKSFSETIQAVLYEIVPPSIGGIAYQVVTDTQHHHYQIVVSGWRGLERIHGIVMQIDIRDGLVWVQEDNSDIGVADKLVEAGISKQQIVLGFHPPYKRPYSGFATGE
jgi:hypothetical protein